ncbi:MAG: L,D-transpeptidase family protein, partial [Planctomycetota bacterium]
SSSSSPSPSPVIEPAAARDQSRDRTRGDRSSRSSSGPSRDAEVNSLISQADALVEQNRLVDARSIFNAALHHPRAGDAAEFIRQRMTDLNEAIVFSTTVFEDDPWTERYTIKSGDRLSLIAPKYDVDWRFIARINRISRPERIRVGQQLKIVRGPFHAFIDKSQYRLDLYLGEPDRQGRRMYIRSFNVGLGEFDSTPTGAFVVRDDSRLVNPPWTNPRTGEHFDADDPMNPIGERWIGLMGVDEETRDLDGYGIHGTIDHDSIGEQRSMGCVRLLPEDVNLIYEVMMEEKSTVFIRD